MDEMSNQAPAEVAAEPVEEMTIEQWAIAERVPVAKLNHLRAHHGDAVKPRHTASEWANFLNVIEKARF